jgi:hypothetical protein
MKMDCMLEKKCDTGKQLEGVEFVGERNKAAREICKDEEAFAKIQT